jgi:hypothetical protein
MNLQLRASASVVIVVFITSALAGCAAESVANSSRSTSSQTLAEGCSLARSAISTARTQFARELSRGVTGSEARAAAASSYRVAAIKVSNPLVKAASEHFLESLAQSTASTPKAENGAWADSWTNSVDSRCRAAVAVTKGSIAN